VSKVDKSLEAACLARHESRFSPPPLQALYRQHGPGGKRSALQPNGKGVCRNSQLPYHYGGRCRNVHLGRLHSSASCQAAWLVYALVCEGRIYSKPAKVGMAFDRFRLATAHAALGSK